MTDNEFHEREGRFVAHMKRFIQAHDGQPQGDILIELERRERWPRIMGAAADVLPAPSVDEIRQRT